MRRARPGVGFLLVKPPGSLGADPVLAPFLDRHQDDGTEPAAGEPVGMRHLVRAVAREYERSASR